MDNNTPKPFKSQNKPNWWGFKPSEMEELASNFREMEMNVIRSRSEKIINDLYKL